MRINKETFFSEVKKKLFTSRFNSREGPGQIAGLDLILNEWEKRELSIEELAYILATAYHETAYTMQPIKERGGDQYLRSKKYWPWIGRGYVQLTWDYNYKKASDKLGINLMKSPGKAMEPEVAVLILFDGMIEGWFTGKKLRDYIDGIDEDDEEDLREYTQSRWIINGKDKRVKIAKEALEFERCLRAAEIKNKKPLGQSRTVQGAGGAAAGGATILIEPVQDVIKAVEGKEDALSSGDLVAIVIGLVVIGGAFYALYARWDDAGRPNIFRRK